MALTQCATEKALTWIHLISVQHSNREKVSVRWAEVTMETSHLARKWARPQQSGGDGRRYSDGESLLVIPMTCHPCYAPSYGRLDLCRGLVAAVIL